MTETARRAATRLVTARMGIPPERFMSTEAPLRATCPSRDGALRILHAPRAEERELVGLLGHAEAKVRVSGVDHHAFYRCPRPSSPENHLTRRSFLAPGREPAAVGGRHLHAVAEKRPVPHRITARVSIERVAAGETALVVESDHPLVPVSTPREVVDCPRALPVACLRHGHGSFLELPSCLAIHCSYHTASCGVRVK